MLNALATLGFIHYQGDLGRDELINAMQIIEQGDGSPTTMRGSWAGAMGQPQFMPSSFLLYAVDFDGDGRRDIWKDKADTIGSIANFLEKHGWTRNLPWMVEVTLPADYKYEPADFSGDAAFPDFARKGARAADASALPKEGAARLFMPAGIHGPILLITHNFDVIKTYNNSNAYVMAVGLLGDAIVGAGRASDALAEEGPRADAHRIEGGADGIESERFRNRRHRRPGRPETGAGDPRLPVQAGPASGRLREPGLARQAEGACVSRRGARRLAALSAALALASLAGVSARAEDGGIGGFFSHLFSPPPSPAPSPSPKTSDTPSPRPRAEHRPRKKPPVQAATREASAPAAPSTPSPQASEFVYVLGDSLAISAADGLDEDLENKPEIGVVDRARECVPAWCATTISIGRRPRASSSAPRMRRSRTRRRRPKEKAAPADKEAETKPRIDYVVVMLGINDMQPMRDGKDFVDPLTDRWKAVYAQRIQAVVAPMHAAHVPVIWVGLPPMRSDKFNAQVVELNQIFKDNAEKAGATFVDNIR